MLGHGTNPGGFIEAWVADLLLLLRPFPRPFPNQGRFCSSAPAWRDWRRGGGGLADQ